MENFMKALKRKITTLFYEIPFVRAMPDEQFIKFKYYIRTKKKLNLKKPQTFNEKLQWLKLYDRNPEYITMVDKYEVRKYITEKIGEEYLIPLLGVWDSFDEIDFNKLPDKFVLKCTHNSGGLVICEDKTKMDIEKVKERLENGLTRNYFYYGREWPYKNIQPKIIAEQFIEEERNFISESLIVYKVFCFNSVPKIVQVIQNDKRPNETIDYFDVEWNLLGLKQNYPNSEVHIEKNECIDKMFELSQQLSEGIPFVRVDWYISKNKLLFSEFTFYSDSGFARFNPEEWDYKLGEMIKL